MPMVKTQEFASVLGDERITLFSSSQECRLITFRTRQNRRLEFFTHDIRLLAGVIPFLFVRRLNEEKCIDTWKMILPMSMRGAKAWWLSIIKSHCQLSPMCS
ncbi:hypothetical protein [Thiorhodovibrio frisius]|uniref:Uncharacterized protein n=1 Tax=Thiorhodovibrio frisius TaxID=631362 RepID=H8YYD7_9GAMM|nr:hypothetical protein [Thiorhodovibrio frisius]EIC23463.1 hypothetical protein Thi970DRAFT_01133 [Thiorhodovibrio frisius]WPL23452.1 hypothetical protein Thiofri_03637 [Thiorhodovibrio frisius]